MTATVNQRVHRSHPKQFPHPASRTVHWYIDGTDAPTEPGTRRFATAGELLAQLKREAGSALQHAKWQQGVLGLATPPKFTTKNEEASRAANLIFLDSPPTDKPAREVILTVVRTSHLTGFYIALQLTPVSRAQLVDAGAWGVELLEYLRRDNAGYAVYGNW